MKCGESLDCTVTAEVLSDDRDNVIRQGSEGGWTQEGRGGGFAEARLTTSMIRDWIEPVIGAEQGADVGLVVVAEYGVSAEFD